jgi:SAM-dependent methyltransferase
MPFPIQGLDEHYGMEADDYFEHHDTEAKRTGAMGLLEQAEMLVGSKGKLLDIGSGRGELLIAAKQQGWDAVGIEPSSSFAERLRRAGVVIRQEPVEQCGFEESSFDVVILAAVLEHLYNPNETIREISRILRPGGALFLDVPNEHGLYFQMGNLYLKLRKRDWVVNLAPTFSPFHVFGFGSKSLRRLLSKYGFEIAKWEVYGGTSVVPGKRGFLDLFEQQAARFVTFLSNFAGLGTYIEVWAIRK